VSTSDYRWSYIRCQNRENMKPTHSLHSLPSSLLRAGIKPFDGLHYALSYYAEGSYQVKKDRQVFGSTVFLPSLRF
jgi:hypothetical protein